MLSPWPFRGALARIRNFRATFTPDGGQVLSPSPTIASWKRPDEFDITEENLPALPFLWRHGRNWRRRPRPRPDRTTDLSRCFRAERRRVPAGLPRRDGTAAHAGACQIRRRLARAAQPDAARHATGRPRMADRAPRQHADQVLRDDAEASERGVEPAAQLYLLHARCAH